MRILDLTFPSAAENLACDEALLDLCEEAPDLEILRFWSPTGYFVVLGYSNKINDEIRRGEALSRPYHAPIPVLRRCSGGGTVLQGPGCLNYSLILKIDGNDALKNISSTNRFIMERHNRALEKLLKKEVQIQGVTDLTLGHLKFSGNAQRRKRKALLFHGSFLLDFDIALIEQTLAMPPREPAYRKSRPHSEFLVNLNISPEKIKEALKKAWGAKEMPDTDGKFPAPLREKIKELVRSRYSADEWNRKF